MQISGISSNLQLNVITPNSGTNFAKGSTIEAEVVDIDVEHQIVTLKQPDGTHIKAQNLSGSALHVGDTVTLMVTDNQGSSAMTTMIALNHQPISHESVTQTQLQLLSIGVSASEDHVQLADLLTKYHQPVTQKTIEALAQIFDKLPGIAEEHAVFMAANDIPPTPENAQALANIGNLHQEINQIIDEINQVLQQLPGGQGKGTIVTEQSGSPTLPAQPNVPSAAQPDAPSLSQPVPADGQTAAAQPSSPAPTQQPDGSIAPSSGQTAAPAGEGQPVVPLDQVMAYIQQNLDVPAAQPLVAKLIAHVAQQTLTQAPTEAQGQTPQTMTLPPQLQTLLEALPPQQAAHLTQLIPKIQGLVQKFMGQTALEQFRQDAFVTVDERLSGELIQSSLSRMPGRLMELSNIKMTDIMNQVAQTLRLSDQTMAYVQIPVTLFNREKTAELYVLKRNKGSKNKSGSDSTKVVFALNTEHIGRVESIITANKSDLTLHIRLESKEIKALIDQNLDALRATLKHTAYQLVSLTTATIDKPINITNAHDYFGYKQLDISI